MRVVLALLLLTSCDDVATRGSFGRPDAAPSGGPGGSSGGDPGGAGGMTSIDGSPAGSGGSGCIEFGGPGGFGGVGGTGPSGGFGGGGTGDNGGSAGGPVDASVPDGRGNACTSTGECAPSEYCSYPDSRCRYGSVGSCQTRPTSCDYGSCSPVCGCDGTVYVNECVLLYGGIDRSALGNCIPPAGWFTCGSAFCSHGSQFCTELGDGSDYCSGFIAGCSSCACMSMPPACACTQSPEGDITIRCP